MKPFDRFPRRLRVPWRSREKIREEVEEEISFHLQMRTEELIAHGADPGSARAQADREFGDLEETRNSLRAADQALESRRRRYEWFHGLALDLRFAVRSLGRWRNTTLAALLTLGLGIGAVTTVFSLVNWIELRPVPGVVDPKRLMLVQMREESGEDETGLSYPNFVDLREGAPALRELAGYGSIGLQATAENAAPAALMGAIVAGDYFHVLGLRPFGGRFFSPEEHGSTGPIYHAVISHRLWRTHLGAEVGVGGRRLRLNGIDFTIIGVAPEGFRGTERLGETDVWVPISTYWPLRHEGDRSILDRRPGMLDELVGRVHMEATPNLVQEQLRSTMAHLVETYPEENEIYSTYRPEVFEGIGLNIAARDHVRKTLTLMLGIVAVVLLIAWANVGNLLLLRGLRRRGETAVRRALGASRARLFRTHVVEGVLLALAGGAMGVLVALGVTRLLRGRLISWLPEIEQIRLDWRVLAFVLGISLLSGALFGVIPLWATKAEAFLHHLKESSRTSTGRASWLRSGLIVVQVSSAMVLMIAALFLARTLHGLSNVEVGFDAERVLTFVMDPSDLGYEPEQNLVFRERLLERLAASPVLESVSFSSASPFGSNVMRLGLRPAEMPEAPPVFASEFSVSPEYLATLGIPLVMGRGLTDAGAEGEVVISQALARQLFGEVDPLGRQILGPTFGGPTPASYTVVGVAGDTRVEDLRAPEPDAVLYRPFSALEPWRSGTVVLVRSAHPRAEAVVREAVAALEPSLAIWHTQAMPEAVANTIREERLLARMAMLLAALAAVLAAIGLYAVVSYSIAQRTREIGIRMALGAQLREIIQLVSRDATPLVAGGIALGTVVAIAGSGVLENRLFGVERLDPVVYGAAAAVFAAAAAIALWGPLRAACGVDPTVALRQE